MPKQYHTLLITRLTTQNAGNEALSLQMIKLFTELEVNHEVRALDRYPESLSWITFASLLKGQPLRLEEAFDQLAARWAAESSSVDAVLPSPATPDLVRLDLSAHELPSWIKHIKRGIGWRRRLAALGLIGQAAMARTLAGLNWAHLVVWNPAGEIHPTGNRNEVLRLLLLMRVAQLKGKRTLIINHSLELVDESLARLVRHVYANADNICVRDDRSLAVARQQLNLPAEKLHVIPDLVFLEAEQPAAATTESPQAFPPGSIGLAINGLEAGDPKTWFDIITALKATGRPIVFISNAMNHDLPFARALAAEHGITCLERQPRHDEIRALYAGLSLLISSRLHSAVLALCEGVPIVTIEPSTFKLTAILEQLHYPIPTTSLSEAGWQQRVLCGVQLALAQRESLSRSGQEQACRLAHAVRESYQQITSQLLGASPH